MENLMTYLLQSSISIAVMYALYWLLLRKETFFAVNRFYLIAAAVLSLILPLFNFSVPVNVTNEVYTVILDTVTVNAGQIDKATTGNLSLSQILLIVFFTGSAIFSVRFIFQMIQLFIIVRKFGINKEDGLKIVFVDRNFSPFSFFNIIFLNNHDLKSDEMKKIIEHEQMHVKQLHSIDLILFEILTIVQWFNPFIWFYKFSLKNTHEFLADEGVVLKGYDKIDYQKLLLSQATGVQVNVLTNNFNQSLLKRRIKMMTKIKSARFSTLKLLISLPLLIGIIFMFSCSKDKEDKSNDTKTEVVKTTVNKVVSPEKITDAKGEEVFSVVEELPQYPGGQNAMAQFLGKNIKYPKVAIEKGIQGKVFISFIVAKDGSIKETQVLRGIGGGCDMEALRVVNMMPKWIPGRQKGKAVAVKYNIPIKFNLD